MFVFTFRILIFIQLFAFFFISGTLSNAPPRLAPRQTRNSSDIVDRIVSHIFTGYLAHQRPVPKRVIREDGTVKDEAIVVDVNMKILSINKVDVINMEFTVDMYLRQFWNDQRLKWSHIDEFRAYTDPIAIPAKKSHLWLPDLFFRNGKQGYLHQMTTPNYLIRVTPEGDLLYSQKVTMRYACQMQLQTFPMDTQTCDMNIGSYGYTTQSLIFKWRKDSSNPDKSAVELDKKMQISEFNTPDSAETIDCTKGSSTSTGSYACLQTVFRLERQLGSYLSGTYIPAILIIAVSWLNFWISIEAVPARVSLGLLTLLGILTQGMSVINSLPRVAYIKAIDVWVIFSLMFVIGAFIEFVLASIRSRRTKMENWQTEIRKTVRSELERLAVVRGPPARLSFGKNNGYPSFPEELEELMCSSNLENGKSSGPATPIPAPDCDVDAYSRFLFPASFFLYNSFYWLYYLVLVHKIDSGSTSHD